MVEDGNEDHKKRLQEVREAEVCMANTEMSLIDTLQIEPHASFLQSSSGRPATSWE